MKIIKIILIISILVGIPASAYSQNSPQEKAPPQANDEITLFIIPIPTIPVLSAPEFDGQLGPNEFFYWFDIKKQWHNINGFWYLELMKISSDGQIVKMHLVPTNNGDLFLIEYFYQINRVKYHLVLNLNRSRYILKDAKFSSLNTKLPRS